jgi:hypothetical protein
MRALQRFLISQNKHDEAEETADETLTLAGKLDDVRASCGEHSACASRLADKTAATF